MKKDKTTNSATMTKQSNKRKALGRGIKALLDNMEEDINATKTGIRAISPERSYASSGWRIPVADIEVNPKQPRLDFDPKALEELAESIRLHDVIQPITLSRESNGKYRVISGERRLRAARMAGLKDIPAYIRTADDQELLEWALLENLQREDLNAIEIALSYQRLMDDCNLTQEQVSERMKKERSTVANYLRLLKLPPDIQEAVRDGHLGMGHARALISLNKVDEQLYVFRETTEKGLSVRQVEQLVRSLLAGDKNKHSTKKKMPLPPAYKRIEDSMASHLSTKVLLNRKKNGKGTIVIDFYNDEDLERIMQQMHL